MQCLFSRSRPLFASMTWQSDLRGRCPKDGKGTEDCGTPVTPSRFWTPVTSTSCKRVGARSLYRALEGRGDQYRERKRKLVEAVVVITTSGMIFINLQDLPRRRDQTEKGEVKPCQMGCRREGEEERGQDILSRAWEKKSNTLDQSVNPTVKTDPGARYLFTVFFFKFAKH